MPTEFFGIVRENFFNGKECYSSAKSTEVSGGIDFRQKILKTTFRTVVVFNRLQNLIEIFALGEEFAGASRLYCLLIQ